MKDQFTVISPSDVVLLEGILVFYNSDIRDMFDMKLFVDTDADTRLARRGKGLFINDVTLRGAGWDIIYDPFTLIILRHFVTTGHKCVTEGGKGDQKISKFV